MENQSMNCPECGVLIRIDEVLAAKLKGELRAEFEKEWNERKEKFSLRQKQLLNRESEISARETSIEETVKAQVKEREERIAKAQVDLELRVQSLDKQVDERVKLRQENLAKREEELKVLRDNLDLQIDERLQAERKKLEEKLRERISKEYAESTAELKEELKNKDELVAASRQQQLALQREKKALVVKQEELELVLEQKLDSERKKIRDEAIKQANEKQQIKMREKDDLISDLNERVQDLQQKLVQGSQERQGEALEGELKDQLESLFPGDGVQDVQRGKKGADIVHIVRNAQGRECGKILWEFKNQRVFQPQWLKKLSQDQQREKADVAALVSVARPKDGDRVQYVQNVWISDLSSFSAVATMLRNALLQIDRERVVAKGRAGLKDKVYDFFTSHEFARHVSLIVNNYDQLQKDLDQEKRSTQRMWAKREIQIRLAVENASTMFGGIQGLLAGHNVTIPSVKLLELSLDDEPEDSETL